MKNPKILINDSKDVYFAFSLEHYLLCHHQNNETIMLLTIVDNSVVLGVAQNPWQEVNIRRLQEDNVNILRRQSGGGTVYIDSGVVCFSVIQDKSLANKTTHVDILLQAIHNLNIKGRLLGRNDIEVDVNGINRKIAGVTSYSIGNAIVDHSCIIVNSSSGNFSKYITPDPKKLHSKGFRSINARIVGLSDINKEVTIEKLYHAIEESIKKYMSVPVEIEHINESHFKDNEEFQKILNYYKSWDTIFGSSPKFTCLYNKRFSWASVDVFFDINKGMIRNVVIFNDSLFPEIIDVFCQKLKHKPFIIKSFEAAYDEVISCYDDVNNELRELVKWLGQTI